MESLANRTLAANMTSFHVPHVERATEKQGTMDTCFYYYSWVRHLTFCLSLLELCCWEVRLRSTNRATDKNNATNDGCSLLLHRWRFKRFNFHTRHILAPDSRGINKRVVVARAESTDAGVNVWLYTLELVRRKDGVAYIFTEQRPDRWCWCQKLNHPQRVLLSDLVFVSRSPPLCLHPRRMMEVSGGPTPLGQSQRCYHTQITVIRWNVTDSLEADDMFTHAWEIWASSWVL